MFITITMNHLRAIKAWVDEHKGQAELDVSSFVLEVKARNRYYRLYPQFLALAEGKMVHVTGMSSTSTAFIGWRPYPPLALTLAADKIEFKQALCEAGLSTPAQWLASDVPDADYVLKRSVGSFGYQLAGPYRAGQVLPSTLPEAVSGPHARGTLYAEAFVQGRNLKVWFWGEQPVHAQCHGYAFIRGDGARTVCVLLSQRLEEVGQAWSTYQEREGVLSSLAYQEVTLDTVMPEGREVWLDYRYGRGFSQQATTELEDNAWPRLPPSAREQMAQAGRWLARVVKKEMQAPVLCAMDGVLDEQGKVWWLEMNSNPICPPTAYFAMLGSLFGTSPKAPSNAFASVVHAQRPSKKRPVPVHAENPS